MSDLCGIRHCRDYYDGVVWQIPICDKHWKRCCAEASGGSLEWLREHARNELLNRLPAAEAVPQFPTPPAPARRITHRSK